MRPRLIRPAVSCGSPGRFESRIHSTSIGAPRLITFKPGALAHDRAPAVGPDNEIGPHLERTSGRLAAHACDAPAVLDETGHLGLHREVKSAIAGALLS